MQVRALLGRVPHKRVEDRWGGSALQGVRRKVPWKRLEGWFGGGRRYALPQNVPQKAFWGEVRKKAG